MKFQSVLCPDGMIVSFKGAFPGRNHDARLLRESNLYTELEQVAVFPDQKFVLYGDQAYVITTVSISYSTEWAARIPTTI